MPGKRRTSAKKVVSIGAGPVERAHDSVVMYTSASSVPSTHTVSVCRKLETITVIPVSIVTATASAATAMAVARKRTASPRRL